MGASKDDNTVSPQHNTRNREQVLTGIALIVYTHLHSTFSSHLKSGVHVVAEFCLCEPRVPAGTAVSQPFVVVSFATNAINEVHYPFSVKLNRQPPVFAPSLLLRQEMWAGFTNNGSTSASTPTVFSSRAKLRQKDLQRSRAVVSHLYHRCQCETRSMSTRPMILIAVDTVDAVTPPVQLSYRCPTPTTLTPLATPPSRTVDLYDTEYHKDIDLQIINLEFLNVAL